MVLEQQDVLKPFVLLQVDDAVAECPHHVLNSLFWELCQAGVVVRGLDDHLMGTQAIHLVEHAVRLAVKVRLNPKDGEFVRHHSNAPSRSITLCRRTTILARAIRQDLRRSLRFVSVTEGTETALVLHSIAQEISGTLCPVGRNNYPPPDDGVFSQLWQ